MDLLTTTQPYFIKYTSYYQGTIIDQTKILHAEDEKAARELFDSDPKKPLQAKIVSIEELKTNTTLMGVWVGGIIAVIVATPVALIVYSMYKFIVRMVDVSSWDSYSHDASMPEAIGGICLLAIALAACYGLGFLAKFLWKKTKDSLRKPINGLILFNAKAWTWVFREERTKNPLGKTKTKPETF